MLKIYEILNAVVLNLMLHTSISPFKLKGRTGLVVRASDSGSGDPGSILRRVGVLFP